ncbi:MAG: division/cell wall cluster transcriptional repressor MraZ [Chitinophagales bacterium]|nr:division/cell wall cluster transcriptional repressor MraZ [Chitinophagales bacterium]
MAKLTGQFECKIDAKGRMKLPAGLLRQLPESNSKVFVINKGLDNNLDLYTEEAWEEITLKLSGLNRMNSRHREFIRAFHKNAVYIEIDSSDRILIPQRSCELAALDKDAVIVCYLGNIEIWAKEVYEKEMSKDMDDFSDMADEIFGNL